MSSRSMLYKISPVAALLLGASFTPFTAFAPSALAAQNNGGDSSEANDFTPIVITASRVAQTVDETLQPVTVITRRDIERSQAQSVADVLRGQPGIAIANNGGQGKTTSLFLRGSSSEHVLVLIDGQKVGSATTGTTAFEDLPVELIERIEIVRGARSSLYGSEAIGGVVQIFTRKGKEALTPTLTVGIGSYGTNQAAATLSGSTGPAWYSLGLSDFATRGFNACQGSYSAGCFAIEPDKDGYHNRSARLRAGWRFGGGSEAEVNLLRAEGHNNFDGGYVNEARTVQQVVGTSLTFNPLDTWQTILRAGQNRDDADNLKDGTFMSRFNTRRDTASWQNEVTLAKDQRLIAGIDWLKDRVDSTTSYTVTSRDDTGVFAQYLAGVGHHDLQFAVRRDDNQQFGKKTTESAAWGYDLENNLRLTASWGTAFHAPTFNQLYYPGFGNAALRPELSRSVDLGLAGKGDNTRWSINAYTARVSDLIGYDASYTPVNINSALLRGLELVGATRLAEWDLRGNLNLNDPQNEAVGANNGKDLPRRAREALSLSGDRTFGPWSSGATLRAEGRRYDDLANTMRLGGYATVDLRVEYHLDKDWRLQARLDNLFDKRYETAYLFNQPGRGAYLTLRYQP